MEYSNTQQTVFTVLKSALWGQPLEYAPGTDWQEVYRELCDQAVAALGVDLAEQIPELDSQLKQTWMRKSLRSMAFWQKLMREQNALKLLLDNAGIPFVVLKGAAAAQYYPQPDRRAMGDVDLIVQPQDFLRAAELMAQNGYEQIENEAYDRHWEYKKNGVLFELHRYFVDMADPEIGNWLDQRIYAEIPQADMATLDRFTVPTLPTADNGLVLLTHIHHHLEGGLGLRQIVDWMLFVDQHLDDDLWEREFEAYAEHLGFRTLAVTVTRMCQLCLGLREDGIRWCGVADEDLCHELMGFILHQGNFGRKTDLEGTTVSIINTFSRISNIPKLLQKHGCINWKALKKYPFLEPFAWLYQLCRYIKKGLSRKHPFRTLWNDIKTSGKQGTLLDRLGVTKRLRNRFENSK